MNSQPALFISHGSPMMVIEDSPARNFLADWGRYRKKPQAILVASAHWENRGGPAVGTAALPDTVHDFGGFPAALYAIEYPAPGATQVAELAIQLLLDAGYPVKPVADRGLDHGVWAPLSLMYPDADIPVFQVSLIAGGSPSEHYRYGSALQTLRKEGVLVIGSGSMTHNLYEFMGHAKEDQAPEWVAGFESWMERALMEGRFDDVMNYRTLAPYASKNHPTDEHLLPLFFALGAAGASAKATRIHSSHTYGVLSMDAYLLAEDIHPVAASVVGMEKMHD